MRKPPGVQIVTYGERVGVNRASAVLVELSHREVFRAEMPVDIHWTEPCVQVSRIDWEPTRTCRVKLSYVSTSNVRASLLDCVANAIDGAVDVSEVSRA